MTTVLPIEQSVPDYHTMIGNVVHTWHEATPRQQINGRMWYDLAHLFAVEHGQSAMRGAGVIAAFTANTSWAENKKLALRAFQTGIASGHTGLNCRKAQAILDGTEPLDVLGGMKARNFYRLIYEPWHPTAVCLDRHAFDVAVGEETSFAARKFLERAGGYEWIADVYRCAASDLHVRPSQLQAVTWLCWRRQKRRLESTFTAF